MSVNVMFGRIGANEIVAHGCWEPRRLEYTLGLSRSASLRDVSDGLSQTVLLQERSGLPVLYLHGSIADQQLAGPLMGAWLPSDFGFSAPPTNVNEENAYNVYSFHPGGAHVAMGDGTAHFLREEISPEVLLALLTSDGGEPIDARTWQ